MQKTQTTLQFFGDTYIAWYITGEKAKRVFEDVRPILEEADFNIINFEGTMSHSRFPFDIEKRYALNMTRHTARLLSLYKFNVATLANNHTLDFGYMGLFETLYHLERSNFKTLGAGRNQTEAIKPLILKTDAGKVCLLTYSRALPMEFWAKKNKPGTSNLSFTATKRAIQRCRKQNDFVFVTYHWGEENHPYQKGYQTKR